MIVMLPSDVRLTVPEAARRLGLRGGDVYRLVFRGDLDGGPAADGAVYVSAVSLDRYVAERPVQGADHRD